MKWLRRVGQTLIAAYFVYALVMIALHPQFIYPFFDRPFQHEGFRTQQIDGPYGDGPTVYVHDAGADAPAVLYFMGNAGSLQYFTSILDHHKRAGRSVIALGYRGGGGLPGVPSEDALKQDALTVFDALPALLPDNPNKIVTHGYSLGTGLALHVARQRRVDHVILSAPYTRLCRLMAKASGLPACWLPGVQKWNSERDTDLAAPVLILHGDEDDLIPVSDGRALAAKINERGSSRATFVEIRGAGHTDLMRFPSYLEAMDRIFSDFTSKG